MRTYVQPTKPKIHELGLPAGLLGTVVALVLRGEDAAARELVKTKRRLNP